MTTSHTALYGIPYPEGDEYVIGGDDAIEALAKHIENITAPAQWAGYASGTIQSAADEGVGVLQSGSGTWQWAYDGGSGVLTYAGDAGRKRPVTIAGGCAFHATQGAQVYVDLLVRGSVVARSEHYAPGTAGVAQWSSHALDWSGFLAPGDTVSMTAYAPDGTPIYHPRLNVVSTGPLQAP